MDVLLLGPLRVEHEGRQVDLGPRRAQRCLLGLLLLHAGEMVQVERLADWLWEGFPPENANGVIRSHISRLRALLDPNRDGGQGVRILAHGSAYMAAVSDGSVDASRFRSLVAEAEQMTDGRLRAAALRRALGLWRGPLLADVASDRLRDRVGAQLSELWLHGWEICLAAELEAGRHSQIVAELQDMVDLHPLRERFAALLMLALQRSGRQSEALETFRRVRAKLVDDFGIDPGPELQRLHGQILRNDPELFPEQPRRPDGQPVRRFLPLDIPDFIGRNDALDWLDAAAQEPAGMVLITSVGGAAGIGKSALATRWAHRAASRYPDGQLYVDLRGYDHGKPVRPMDALTRLLRCLDTPVPSLPTTLEEASARFRTAVAGKRMLILLDNARTAGQVRPLLPDNPSCLVLVTSRDEISGLVDHDGARQHRLDLLTDAEAIELLRRLIGSDRVDRELKQAQRLVSLCEHLPLALRVAAGQLADLGNHSIRDYVTELAAAQEQTTVSPLTRGGAGQDWLGGAALRSVLDVSYQALPLLDQRLLRLTGCLPGPDFTPDAVAAVAGVELPEAVEVFERLVRRQLLAPRTADLRSPARYALHDLVRDYAAGALARSRTDDAQAALRALCDHYIGSVPGQQTAWLEAERANLVATVFALAVRGAPDRAGELALGLWRFFDQAGHTHDWISTFEAVESAGRDLAERSRQAEVLHQLGSAYQKSGRYDEAVAAHRRCLALREQLGDADGAAASLRGRARSYEALGRFDEALVDVEAALAVVARTGNRALEAELLSGSLAAIYLHTGRYGDARDRLLSALPAIRAHGMPRDTGRALARLAETHRRLDQPADGLPYLLEALQVADGAGDRDSQGWMLCTLGRLRRDLGQPVEAVAALEQAVEIVRESGLRDEEGSILNELAALYAAVGQVDRSVATYLRALAVAREAGARHHEAKAHLGLGTVVTGDNSDTSREHVQQALRILRNIDPAEAAEAEQRLERS